MDSAHDSTEDASQEPSSTPVIEPPAVNPRENLVVMDASANDNDGSPTVAGEFPLTMQGTKGSLGRDHEEIFTESILSSKSETDGNIASVASGDDASDASGTSAKVPQSNQSPTTENLNVRIIALPSPEDNDDNITSPSSSEGKNGDIDHLIAKVPINSYISKQLTADLVKMANIDTSAPFASVRAAVSKFGGIVDWKAHRTQTVERRKIIEQELGKVHQAIPLYKKCSEEAEEAKLKVLKDLENTERMVEELKLNLERLQKEEEQAKQDSELAKLRVAEVEKGIAVESSVAAKAQIDIARARHETAAAELKSTTDELEQLKKDYDFLLAEKDESMKKTEEAISMSKEVEKSMEDLTINLIAAKESLESAHAAHLEAEEHRIGAVMAKEQDIFNWEKDLKQAEEELEKLRQQLLSSKDLKSKLDTATALLQDLKAELAAYIDSKSDNLQDAAKETSIGIRKNVEAALLAAKKELEQVNLNIEKATDEVNILMVAAAALKSELEKEKAELAAIQQQEGMASIAVASLEAELNKTKSENGFAQVQEKEQREKLVQLPKQLQMVAVEAGHANELEKVASDELKRAKEEAEQAKAGASTMESRLRAVQKEIEAAKASEKLALAAIKALVESESAELENGENSGARVTLSLEEYYELSKKAEEAEEQANARVAAALSQIDIAKESELTTLSKLEEASREMSHRKEALQDALHKSEEAVEGKMGIEQELRNWRAESKERRTSGESVPAAKDLNKSSEKRSESETLGDTRNSCAVELQPTLSSHVGSVGSGVQLELKAKKKKKFMFPKIFMFLGKKKKSAASVKS